METSPGFQDSTTAKVAVALSVLTVTSFALYAVVYSRRPSVALQAKSLEAFLTARKSIGWRSIGWSFYASAMGSWVITAPAEFGYYGGILGSVSYAFASAIPLLMIAFFGGKINKVYPTVLSLSDFVYWRFGRVTQVLVVLISLLNMSVAATAEYTTLSSLYSDFVGLGDYTAFIVILIALVTLSYTIYGGLKASIVTDKAQAVLSLFLVQVVVVFLLADFNKEEIAEDIAERGYNASFEVTDDILGLNLSGYSSVFTLPMSLMTATIFSEALWQRSWAAEDNNALQKGAVLGAVLVFIVVSFFGAIGILVAWANLVEDPFTFNANLFAFQVFRDEANSEGGINSLIGVLVLLLGTTMAEGAIDSLQNGIGASINGALGRFYTEKEASGEGEGAGKPLFVGRVVLTLLNIPFIFLGLQKYSILSLFLLGNMICICAFFPISIGFLADSPFHPYLRDFQPPLCFALTLFATMIFGGIYYPGQSFGEGVQYVFWLNTFYEYQYFLAALIFSVFITITVIGITAMVSPPRKYDEFRPNGEKKESVQDLEEPVAAVPVAKQVSEVAEEVQEVEAELKSVEVELKAKEAVVPKKSTSQDDEKEVEQLTTLENEAAEDTPVEVTVAPVNPEEADKEGTTEAAVPEEVVSPTQSN